MARDFGPFLAACALFLMPGCDAVGGDADATSLDTAAWAADPDGAAPEDTRPDDSNPFGQEDLVETDDHGSADVPVVVTSSRIEIDPPARSVEIDGSLSSDYPITITNTGQGKVLNVSEVVLEYTPASDAEAGSVPAFSIEVDALPARITPVGEGGDSQSFEITVKFQPYDDSLTRTATLTIRNDNTEDPSLQDLRIQFTTRACEPALVVPAKVDFGLVSLESGAMSMDVPLTNAGLCDLRVDWIVLEGSPAFGIDLGDGRTFAASDTGQTIALTPPVTIAANSGIAWTSAFAPTDDAPASATLTIHSNETGVADGLRLVAIAGNASGPRIQVQPPELDFGGRKVGKPAGIQVEVHSVGTQPLVVTGIAIKTPDSSPDFSLDFTDLPGGVAPTPQAPLTIQVNGSLTFLAVFTPGAVNPRDPISSEVVRDTGSVAITTDAVNTKTLVPLTGFGVEVECPQPVIVIEEGEEARPQDILHLHGEQSQAASGSIQSYARTVSQPSDNKFLLVPAANAQTVTHEVNVDGDYTYCLDVCDSDACSDDDQCHTTACKGVAVAGSRAIHCELTWNTPGDPDQFDSGDDAGSDMDLHFLHPFATGPDLDDDGRPDGWFDVPYDVLRVG